MQNRTGIFTSHFVRQELRWIFAPKMTVSTVCGEIKCKRWDFFLLKSPIFFFFFFFSLSCQHFRKKWLISIIFRIYHHIQQRLRKDSNQGLSETARSKPQLLRLNPFRQLVTCCCELLTGLFVASGVYRPEIVSRICTPRCLLVFRCA